MKGKGSEVTSFTYNQIQELLGLQEFQPHLMQLSVGVATANRIITNLSRVFQLNEYAREQWIIKANDHWYGLDVEVKKNGTLSIVVLDAANDIRALASFTFLMKQFSESMLIPISIEIIHITTSTAPLQRDGRNCAVFAWELAHWASAQNDLHTRLRGLISPEDQNAHLREIAPKVRAHYSAKCPPMVVDQIVASLQMIDWLDYETLLLTIEDWSGFFMNSQSLPEPECLKEILSPWLIEKKHPVNKQWVMYNLRSDYCSERMHAILEARVPKSETDFILEQVRHSHDLKTHSIGQVLRTAVASGLAGQVRNILRCVGPETAETIVNEVPPSGFTALKRAEASEDAFGNKEAIIAMLRAYQARASSSIMFFDEAAPEPGKTNKAPVLSSDKDRSATSKLV